MIEITNTAGGIAYPNPFTSQINDTGHVKLDTSTMTADTGSGGEVDAYGYLKPGVPLKSDGTLVSGSSQVVYGVTMHPIKLPGRTSGSSPALSGDTTDPIIGVALSGTINRDAAEDILGRAYSANELAALTAGGFKVTTT